MRLMRGVNEVHSLFLKPQVSSSPMPASVTIVTLCTACSSGLGSWLEPSVSEDHVDSEGGSWREVAPPGAGRAGEGEPTGRLWGTRGQVRVSTWLGLDLVSNAAQELRTPPPSTVRLLPLPSAAPEGQAAPAHGGDRGDADV